MDTETRERFDDIDAALLEIESRLPTIARQNATLSEMVEVLGGYVNVGVEALQDHVRDPDAHQN